MYEASYFELCCYIENNTLFVDFTVPPLSLSEQEVLRSWDNKIRNVCTQVNSIVDQIASIHPKWVAESMEEQMAH